MSTQGSGIELSIILPAYEEAKNLAQLLPILKATAGKLSPSFEILVVDTEKPKDETPGICAEHGISYIPRQGGGLYCHAVKTGIGRAQGKWVLFMDADGSHPPQFIPELWAQREAADIIIASRYVQGRQTENPAVLIFMSLAVNYIFRIVLGLKCADVSNSFRLYKGDHLRALTLECENFDIVEEILIKLCILHPRYKLKEIPFTFEKRKAGKSKRKLLSFALGYLSTLIHFRNIQRNARKTTLLK